MKRIAKLMVVLALGCSPPAEPAAPHGDAPARPRESDLAIVRVDATTIASLGIATTAIAPHVAARTRTVGGVVTVPPGRRLGVTAPVAGTLRAGARPLAAGMHVGKDELLVQLVPIAPVDRDTRAQSRRQRDASKARLEVARARLDRTRTLVAQRGASQRALEEAEAELATAEAEDAAASARERMLRRAPLDADAKLGLAAPQDGVVQTIAAVPGQSVAAGTVLLEITATQSLWVRVPLAPAELERIALAAPAQVMRLGASTTGLSASPVDAPPSADPVAATVDLFYALPSDAAGLRPGERVAVELRYRAYADARSVPASAIVSDFDGGTWIYECVDDGAFRRRRVEVLARDGDVVLLRHAPPLGTCVVAIGALELLGAELGVAH